jgi:hypothetical protein
MFSFGFDIQCPFVGSEIACTSFTLLLRISRIFTEDHAKRILTLGAKKIALWCNTTVNNFEVSAGNNDRMKTVD